MVNGFMFSADRKALRERAQELLDSPTAFAPKDPVEFVWDTAKVVVRLLDTIDHFEQANFKLSKHITDLDLLIQELSDKKGDLVAKNSALEEYASQMERERDTALETLDLQRIEMMEVSGEYMPKPTLPIPEEIRTQISRLFARGNEQEEEINKIKARLNKKKAVKKITTPKKTTKKK